MSKNLKMGLIDILWPCGCGWRKLSVYCVTILCGSFDVSCSQQVISGEQRL